MKLGLLTDIHEHVENLRSALDSFAGQEVDQVVVIGDVCETGEWIEETCRLLAEAGAVGVWGNHDFGMCVEPSEKMRTKYPAVVLDFMTSLQPRLEIEGCYFAHVEPWLNPEELTDLWYFDGPPDEHGKLDRIFDAVPHRIMFAGHYHKWLLAAPDGIKDWKGDHPVNLAKGRFVLIGALCEGRFAVFDTDSSELVPFNEK